MTPAHTCRAISSSQTAKGCPRPATFGSLRHAHLLAPGAPERAPECGEWPGGLLALWRRAAMRPRKGGCAAGCAKGASSEAIVILVWVGSGSCSEDGLLAAAVYMSAGSAHLAVQGPRQSTPRLDVLSATAPEEGPHILQIPSSSVEWKCRFFPQRARKKDMQHQIQLESLEVWRPRSGMVSSASSRHAG